MMMMMMSFRNHLKTHYFSSAFDAFWHLIHIRLDYNMTTALYKSSYLLFTSRCNQGL